MNKSFLKILLIVTALILTIFLVIFIYSIQNPSTNYFGQNVSKIIAPVTTIDYNISNQQLSGLIRDFLDNNPNYQIDSRDPDIILNYQPIDSDSESDKYFSISEALVPIIHRQTLVDNINLSELKSINSGINVGEEHFDTLVVVKNMKEQIVDSLSMNPDTILALDDISQVIDQVSSNPNFLGLIPISQLTIDVHPLKIENISALDETEKFPVNIDIHIPTKFENDPLIKNISDNYVIPSPTEILSVGDIMMGRYVGVKINRSGDPIHSVEYVWEELSKPDLTFAQLETPIATTTLTSEGMILVAQPETVTALTQSGIDLVSISGNHFGDALRDGMEETFLTLEQNHIIYIGAGRNKNDSFTPKIIEKNGTRYGFLSFVNIMPDSYGAGEDYAGSAWVDFNSIDDQNLIIDSIQQARTKSDIVIVGFHWGTEYTPHPTQTQQEIAHLAIDNGADMIIGTHPHVVQADEVYKDKYINYSLGNFIMDQMWSEETQEGVLLYIYTLDDKIISYNLVPTHVVDYSQVKILSKEEGRNILERIWQAGKELI